MRAETTHRSMLYVFALSLLLHGCGPPPPVPDTLPTRLTDRELQKMITDFSEPDGYFPSDNFLSNESGYQSVIPTLIETVAPGGVYIGVGPEQNFTYIVALQPKIAFIVDVRRGNTDLHLMYKALFDLSRDRADCVSRLLSRPRPDGLTPKSTAGATSAAFARLA